MSRKIFLPLGILVILLGILASGAFFTVHQAQQALVMQFGEPKRVITEPGLKMKLPFVQNVMYYEKRVLDLDPPSERVLLSDQKPLDVNTFVRYRIENPLRFYQTVRLESNLRDRMGSIINANLRSTLGNVNLASVLSEERSDIMRRIHDTVNNEAERFGIEVVDVRIGRTDLPREVSEAVYSRMRSEREREAAEFRAQGEEEAQRIRSSADREATVIRAEAEREADMLRGTGEGRRTTILSEAFGAEPEFFNFYRTMQAYEGAINQDDADNSYIVLSTENNEFFRLFGQGALAEGSAFHREQDEEPGPSAAAEPLLPQDQDEDQSGQTAEIPRVEQE